jgi:hypothetical protein
MDSIVILPKAPLWIPFEPQILKLYDVGWMDCLIGIIYLFWMLILHPLKLYEFYRLLCPFHLFWMLFLYPLKLYEFDGLLYCLSHGFWMLFLHHPVKLF